MQLCPSVLPPSQWLEPTRLPKHQGAHALHLASVSSPPILSLVVAELERLQLFREAIGKPDYLGRTPLCKALANGNFKNSRFLVSKGADPRVRSLNGDTLLMALAKARTPVPRVVSWLLTLPIDLAAVDAQGKSALRLVMENESCSIKVISLLLEALAPLPTSDLVEQAHLLIRAASTGTSHDLDVLAAAVDPAVFNVQDEDGKTALHHAARRFQDDSVFRLFRRGANPEIADKAGIVPIQEFLLALPVGSIIQRVSTLKRLVLSGSRVERSWLKQEWQLQAVNAARREQERILWGVLRDRLRERALLSLIMSFIDDWDRKRKPNTAGGNEAMLIRAGLIPKPKGYRSGSPARKRIRAMARELRVRAALRAAQR